MTEFCTIGDLENLIQIEIPAQKIPFAEAAIKAATEAIRNYTHQVISLVEDDLVVVDGDGRTRLFLPELPVGAVTTVTVDGVTLIDDEDYKLGQYGVLYRLGGYVWASGVQNIEITYTHGYTTLPDDIVSVCARAAARAYQVGLRSAELGGVSVSSMGLGDYQVTYGQEQSHEGYTGVSGARLLMMSEKDLLNRYRLVSQ